MVQLEGTTTKASTNVETQKSDAFASATITSGNRSEMLEALRAGPHRGERFEIAKGAPSPTQQDMVRIGQAVNQEMASRDIGGRGWTGNLSDANKCGEVNFQAAEALREAMVKAGFKDVRVGQVNSENGNMLMGNGLHSVAVAYSPSTGKGVIVDAWQNPRKVVEVNVQVTRSSGFASDISVNFPSGTPGHREKGYQGTVIDVDLK